jgi:hypothetical protein
MLITDASGTPVSGLSVTYAIYNSATNILVESGSLIDIGNGIYQKIKVFNIVGQFRVEYSTPSNYTDEVETILVIQDQLTAIQDETDKIKYILGLVQSNMVITNQVYDINNNLISGTIKLYNNAADANAQINEFATYSMTATYTSGLLTHYKVTQL